MMWGGIVLSKVCRGQVLVTAAGLDVGISGGQRPPEGLESTGVWPGQHTAVQG